MFITAPVARLTRSFGAPANVRHLPESGHPTYAPQGRKLNFNTARSLRVPSQIFSTSVHAPIVSRVSGSLLDLWVDDFKCIVLNNLKVDLAQFVFFHGGTPDKSPHRLSVADGIAINPGAIAPAVSRYWPQSFAPHLC